VHQASKIGLFNTCWCVCSTIAGHVHYNQSQKSDWKSYVIQL